MTNNQSKMALLPMFDNDSRFTAEEYVEIALNTVAHVSEYFIKNKLDIEISIISKGRISIRVNRKIVGAERVLYKSIIESTGILRSEIFKLSIPNTMIYMCGIKELPDMDFTFNRVCIGNIYNKYIEVYSKRNNDIVYPSYDVNWLTKEV
tara:strand:- start:1332 stop:1781 length:450 start_codon:yes stop_codon:yes gene_type:complete